MRGITWNHSRGFVSVVATAQRYCELHPDVEISWDKRSLQEFADAPIQDLAERYDLLVIDHPWAGYAAHSGVLLPLQDWLPEDYLRDQAANSVGQSHASYIFDGSQCALAIDAATPVAAYRPDLLERYDLAQPQTWHALLDLARSGRVIMPGIPIDTLMNFYMLCATQGEPPFRRGRMGCQRRHVPAGAGAAARDGQPLPARDLRLESPFRYTRRCHGETTMYIAPSPTATANYSRAGYSDNLLVFDDMVNIGGQGRCQTTLGGTGLAISSACQAREIACDYAMYSASPLIQRTLFFENGGQPGHRRAWLDEEVNRRSRDYFRNTLPALDRAYLRPRFPGYLHFQDYAGAPIREYLMRGGDARSVLAGLKNLFAEAKRQHN